MTPRQTAANITHLILARPERMRRLRQEVPPNDAVLQRGIAACKRGDLEAAARDLQTVVLVEPKNAEALSWLGYVLLRQGKASEAIPYLERTLLLRPGDPDAITNLGNALLQKPGRNASDTHKAVGLFELAVQRAPNSGEAHYNLGYARARVGQYEQAVVSYRRAVALLPQNGLAWTNLGYGLMQVGKKKEAVEALRQAVIHAPQESGTWVALGSLEMANGNEEAAAKALQNARKLDPKNPDVLMGLGRAYSVNRRFREAAEAFAEAAEMTEAIAGNKDVTPRYNQGVALARWGKLNEAMTAYTRVLEVDPAHYEALVNSGYILFRQKKVDEAVLRFKDAIKVNNQLPLAWTNLAAACEAQKNWTGAAFAWRRALALDGKQYDWYAHMAADFLQMKRYQDAAVVYRDMARLWPDKAEPRLELGRIFELRASLEPAEKVSWLTQAHTEYQAAAHRDPTNTEARTSLDRVASMLPAPANTPGGTTPTAPPKPAGTNSPTLPKGINPAPVNPAEPQPGAGGTDL